MSKVSRGFQDLLDLFDQNLKRIFEQPYSGEEGVGGCQRIYDPVQITYMGPAIHPEYAYTLSCPLSRLPPA